MQRTSRPAREGELEPRAPRARHESFEADARAALDGLRAAVARILDHLPAARDRAADLRRALDLDAALAWQIHTIAASSDPLRAGRVVPKAGAMQRFLDQARARRIPGPLIEEARAAYADFEEAVAHHAGSRGTFEAMLSALRPDDGATLKRLRRAAHRADAAVWGLSVRLRLNCVVFHERPTGEHDCLVLRARIGVRCLREGASIGIYASGLTWGGDGPAPSGGPNVASDACELLEEFCTGPVPSLRPITGENGRRLDHLELTGLGRSREVSVYWRNLSLDFPGGSSRPPHGSTAECLEPTELTVMDMLIPRGWTDPRTARSTVTPLAALHGPAAAGSPIPFEGTPMHLPPGLENLHLRQAPRYTEALERSLAERGWPVSDFDVYRSEVPYPILHTAAHLRIDGPAAG